MFPSKVFGSRSRLCNSLGNSSPLLSTVFTHLTTAVVVVSSVVANSDVGITVVVSWNGIFSLFLTWLLSRNCAEIRYTFFALSYYMNMTFSKWPKVKKICDVCAYLRLTKHLSVFNIFYVFILVLCFYTFLH